MHQNSEQNSEQRLLSVYARRDSRRSLPSIAEGEHRTTPNLLIRSRISEKVRYDNLQYSRGVSSVLCRI